MSEGNLHDAAKADCDSPVVLPDSAQKPLAHDAFQCQGSGGSGGKISVPAPAKLTAIPEVNKPDMSAMLGGVLKERQEATESSSGGGKPDMSAMLGGVLKKRQEAAESSSGGSKPDMSAMLGGVLKKRQEAAGDTSGGGKPDMSAMLGGVLKKRQEAAGDTSGGGKPDMSAMLGGVLMQRQESVGSSRHFIGTDFADRKPSAFSEGNAVAPASVLPAVAAAVVTMAEDEVYGAFVRAMQRVGLPLGAAMHKFSKEHPNLSPSPLADFQPEDPAPRPRPLHVQVAPSECAMSESSCDNSANGNGSEDYGGFLGGAQENEGEEESKDKVLKPTRRLFWEPLSEMRGPSVFGRLPIMRPRGGGRGSLGAEVRAAAATTFAIVETQRVETEAERLGRQVQCGAISLVRRGVDSTQLLTVKLLR
jgi:hypothetical protein